jgi:hypothetical protein
MASNVTPPMNQVLVKRLLWVSSFLSYFVTHSVLAQTLGMTSARAAQENEICVEVIRSEMKSWYRNADKEQREAKDQREKDSAKEMNFKVFLVSVNGKDPVKTS